MEEEEKDKTGAFLFPWPRPQEGKRAPCSGQLLAEDERLKDEGWRWKDEGRRWKDEVRRWKDEGWRWLVAPTWDCEQVVGLASNHHEFEVDLPVMIQ